MLKRFEYNRIKAVEYANKWAYLRNPRYIDFDKYGGDCTNFCSQSIYEGSKVMNYTKTFGWYYNSSYDRSPSWTGVKYLYNFLINNNSQGPQAIETSIEKIELGDIIQLSTNGQDFHHSVVVVSTGNIPSIDNIFISCHTYDSRRRPLNTYNIYNMRCIHITGVMKYV